MHRLEIAWRSECPTLILTLILTLTPNQGSRPHSLTRSTATDTSNFLSCSSDKQPELSVSAWQGEEEGVGEGEGGGAGEGKGECDVK